MNTVKYTVVMNHMATHKNRYWLALIILGGLALRLYPYADLSTSGVSFVGTCGALLDEVKPLVDSGNLLNFEVFFYPPVAPLIIAVAAKIVSSFVPGIFDLGLFCVFTTILFSTATIVVIYYIGMKWTPTVGLLAAAFYAVTMVAVDSATNVQVYSAFFALLAIYFFYKSHHQQTSTNLMLMGVFLGLAIGSKYFPVVLIPMFFLLHLVRGRTPDSKLSGAVSMNRPGMSLGHFQNFVLNISLAILVIVCASLLYFGVFHEDSLLMLVKAIYDANSHDHPFEYHLNSIQRILKLGLLGVGAVGLCAFFGILIPTIKNRDSWEWALGYCRRHRLWLLPCAGLIITLFISIGIPAIANLNHYAAYTVWMTNAYASADGGMFPAGRPAPSYFLSFFPESLGIPLFLAACAGLGYCLVSRDRKAILLLIIVLPLYLMLEKSSVKVNRYALELMPIFCLFAAIGLDHLRRAKSSPPWRVAVIVLSFAILSYSTLYVLAWANVSRPGRDVRIETAKWIKTNVAEGSRIGMNGELWLAGSPQLIPDSIMLNGYRIESYASLPEYIILPKLIFDVVQQYIVLTKAGYEYRQADWSPQAPPPQDELEALINVVSQREYLLVKEFERFPALGGISFDNQRFGDRTWLREHAGAYGLQIYQRRLISTEKNAKF